MNSNPTIAAKITTVSNSAIPAYYAINFSLEKSLYKSHLQRIRKNRNIWQENDEGSGNLFLTRETHTI
jgi:hypothetical protein